MNTHELLIFYKNSSDGFLSADPNGRILCFNPTLEQLSGFSLKAFLNKNMDILVREGFISRSTALEAIHKKMEITGKIQSKVNGKELVVTAKPIFSRGKLERIVCTARDYLILNEIKATGTALKQYSINSHYKVINLGDGHQLVYNDKEMELLIASLQHVSKVDSTVMLYGETGVGKELIARFIHKFSPRKNNGFIKVNCASIPSSLFEAELFGYEPGSFTGALKSGKIGYFELAHKGTIFLDEIAELPIEIQAKLLSVLQDSKINKVGSAKANDIDTRVIAATNKNLSEMVKEGRFREDLFYRLNVIPFQIASLRERKDSIPALIDYFTGKFIEKYALGYKEISMEVINHLSSYPWPGNVRELSNLIERILVLTPKQQITLNDLPEDYYNHSYNKKIFTIHDTGPLKETVDDFQSQLIFKTLEQYKTQREAAKRLKVSFSNLSKKIKKLNVNLNDKDNTN